MLYEVRAYKALADMYLTVAFWLLSSQEVYMALYYWFTIFQNHSNLLCKIHGTLGPSTSAPLLHSATLLLYIQVQIQ
jgi:hypothetical protein